MQAFKGKIFLLPGRNSILPDFDALKSAGSFFGFYYLIFQ
jgi:hypothetical protein